VSLIAAAGPSAYWYLARGTGVVALLLLTVSVVLGILGSLRFALAPAWPRFAIDTLHRDVSLVVIALLVVHIVTSVLDSFAPIGVLDSVIPFTSSYRPLWLGLGALSFDLLVALVITSLVRRRVGYQRWRLIHWLAYASWPVAVLHGIGTGTDAKLWWMIALTAGCVAAVLVATVVRISRAGPEFAGLRPGATALTLATPLGIAIFTLVGPLQPGWARRAGTPASLLGAAVPARATLSSTPAPAPAGRAVRSFSARLSGTVTQTQEPNGAIVDLAMRLSGGAQGRLRVRLAGAPINGGGLSMTGSQVDLIANGLPSVMAGQIVSLQGQQFVARVANGSGSALTLQATLNIDSQSGTVTGSLSASAAGSGG
jgi:methionine sulfoxide reductase heme-binding subunit